MLNIILFTSIFFWLLPPIRQYGGKYFYYFLIIALTDPIVYLLRSIGIFSNFLMIFSSLLLVLSISNFNLSKKLYIIILLLLLLSWGLSFLDPFFQIWISIFTNGAILLLILKAVIIEVFKSNKLNVFYLGIILLETTYITRFIAILTGINTGLAFYLITQIFQILIAIFYTIFREDSSTLIFKLSDEKI